MNDETTAYYNEIPMNVVVETDVKRCIKWVKGTAVPGAQGEARGFTYKDVKYIERTYWVRLRGFAADTVQVTSVTKDGEPTVMAGFHPGQNLILTLAIKGSKEGGCGLPRLRILNARQATDKDEITFRPRGKTAEEKVDLSVTFE